MSFTPIEPGPRQRAFRQAEKAVKNGQVMGGGTCANCGHTMSSHWGGVCIRNECGCGSTISSTTIGGDTGREAVGGGWKVDLPKDLG